jgi:hypothetical protein
LECIKRILSKYSQKGNYKTKFLELGSEFLSRINNSTSAKFFLTESRITIPTGTESEEYFCRDLFVKCKLLVNLKIFLHLLEKSEEESLKEIFQYEDVLFKQFNDKFKKSVQMFESNELTVNLNLILKQLVSGEKDWDNWKTRKCEGNIIKPENQKPPKTQNKFAKLEEEDVNIKVKASSENQLKTKYIFKRSNERKELDKLKNWISLKDNNDLINNLETDGIWIDREPIGMNFNVMAEECLGEVSVEKIKEQIEQFEATMQSQKNADEYVKWRFKNRLMKRSYETMVNDHEKDFYQFLHKNVNCLKNKSIIDHANKYRYKKESQMLRDKAQTMVDFRKLIMKNDKGKLL